MDAFVTKVSADGSAVAWSSFLGGQSNDQGFGVAVDGSGNVYVTGTTSSSDCPTLGGFDTSYGSTDGFVTKVNEGGSSLAWSSFLGGSLADHARAVTLDDAGAVYVTGNTVSTDFPANGGFDSAYGGGNGSDAFVAKVNADGASVAWSSYLGESADDAASSVAVDGSLNVYVAGSTRSTDFPTDGGFDTTQGGSYDAFVAKVNAVGSSLAWSSYLGGSAQDYGYSMALDGVGSAYVTGATGSTDFPVSGGFDASLGGLDAFVTKVSVAGSSLAWSSYLGGAAGDDGYSIAVDGSGNVYVAGETYSSDFPVVGGFDTNLGGNVDGFVARIDAAGSSLSWASYLGGSADDRARGVAVDGPGNVYVAGYTWSSDFPSSGGFDTSLGGNIDAFVTRINACTTCGDGCCLSPTETTCTCPQDCGTSCGDLCCNGNETECTCPGECTPACGDGCCDVSEGPCSGPGCDTDCPPACGDGCCTGAENACACALDCGPDVCGNGCCGTSENLCTCPDDCGQDSCGNGCCGAETACTCAADCAGDPGELRRWLLHWRGGLLDLRRAR